RLVRGGGGRPVGILLLVLLTGALLAPRLPAFHHLRLANFDAYQALAPRQRISAPVVIVAIDDTSLARQGQWPWPRTVLARLITRIAEADPAVVGLDIVMSEVDRLSPGRLLEVVRQIPLLASLRGTLVPRFATELLRVGTREPAIAVYASADGVRAIGIGELRIPTETDGTIWVHYGRHDENRFISAADVLAGKV